MAEKMHRPASCTPLFFVTGLPSPRHLGKEWPRRVSVFQARLCRKDFVHLVRIRNIIRRDVEVSVRCERNGGIADEVALDHPTMTLSTLGPWIGEVDPNLVQRSRPRKMLNRFLSARFH